MQTFQVESCVQGHHIQKDVWPPSLGEVLQCTRELENNKDRYAVKIAAASALFLARKGTICCEVTGTRCYSEDHPQGGLKIPCKLTFSHRADSAPRA